MPTRILQIIPNLEYGGAEKQLSLLANGLPRDQFDVHVCALDQGGPIQQNLDCQGIPTAVIGRSWKVDPLAYLRLQQYIRNLKPDLVHTWRFDANSYGRAAARAAGVRHIVASEPTAERSTYAYESAMDRRLTRYTQRIVASRSGIRDALVRRGLPPEKLQIIPNAVDANTACGRLSKQQLCQELAIPTDSRLILTVGELCVRKRIKDLIWAADLLKCVRDDTHLLIVGVGPQRWRLNRYRQQCEITDRVHFLGRRSDVLDLLPLCECLWLASGREGQSNAIMEAMAASLPVVATDISSNRELVTQRESGFLVSVGDRAAFAKWTHVLLSDQRLAGEMGRRGQRRMREHFSVKQMVDRHVRLYEELCN